MQLRLQDFRDAAKSHDDAASVVVSLGCLAKWIVKPCILKQIVVRLNRPDLSGPVTFDDSVKRPGGCLVVMANEGGETTILDDGYLLPMHWQRGGEHGLIPPMLKQLANKVLHAMNVTGYSLHLMLPGQKGPSEVLLSDVNDEVNSGFCALACGLKMLLENVSPDYRTVCTGKWEGDGIKKISHAEQKTRTVFEFPRGALERYIHHWFVPTGDNTEQASKELEALFLKSPDHPITLRQFPSSGDIHKSLCPLFARSGVKPQDEAEFSVLQEYSQWLRQHDQDAADEYYRETLYKQICVRGLGREEMDPKPTHFVAVVSSPALIGLAQELFRFSNVLILYSMPDDDDDPEAHSPQHHLNFSEKAGNAKELISRGTSPNCRIVPESFMYRANLSGSTLIRDLAKEFENPISEFLADVEPGLVMWDMTSGLRLFSHLLEKRFTRNGDWMLSLNHQWSAHFDHRIPCTETIVFWRHVTEGPNPVFRGQLRV